MRPLSQILTLAKNVWRSFWSNSELTLAKNVWRSFWSKRTDQIIKEWNADSITQSMIEDIIEDFRHTLDMHFNEPISVPAVIDTGEDFVSSTSSTVFYRDFTGTRDWHHFAIIYDSPNKVNWKEEGF